VRRVDVTRDDEGLAGRYAVTSLPTTVVMEGATVTRVIHGYHAGLEKELAV
jgi:hypothetical protein